MCAGPFSLRSIVAPPKDMTGSGEAKDRAEPKHAKRKGKEGTHTTHLNMPIWFTM